MTVPVQTIFSASVANGVTTSFPYAFKITDSEDLQVSVDGVVQTTGFTVSGVGNELGGNVVFSVAPANGAKVLRYLVPVLKREVDYQQFGDWLAEVVNNEFDRIWLATQAFKQDGLRALKLPVDTETDQVIALDAVDRANKAIIFDADGNVTVSIDDYDDQAANAAASAAAAAASESAAATSENNAASSAAYAAASATSAASVVSQDLSAIDRTVFAATIVDTFLYDTEKDSDGGAWRKRCAHTSWENETLSGNWLGSAANETAARAISGATTGSLYYDTTAAGFYKLNAGSGVTQVYRGNVRQFPAQVLITVESARVVIWDLTQTGCPMWMVFGLTYSSSAKMMVAPAGLGPTSISAMGAKVCLGSSGAGLSTVDFLADRGTRINATATYAFPAAIASRNSELGGVQIGAAVIVNATVNAVAMTVLPNAPVDVATGLPVPTIAVATDGNATYSTSVIKDDGTVVNIASDSTGTAVSVAFDGIGLKVIRSDGAVYYWNDVRALTTGMAVSATVSASTTPAALGTASKQAKRSLSSSTGLTLMRRNQLTLASSMLAYITKDYTSGWMVGDIRGAWLADTVAETKTGGTDTDRSVKANNLTVNGSLTKAAVASGAALVGYSGWSAANYCAQAYSANLDFGTGDFCIMGWAKFAATAAKEVIFCRDSPTTGKLIRLQVDVTTSYLSASAFDGTTTRTATGAAAIDDATWKHVLLTYSAGTLTIYVNGVSYATATGAALLTLNNATAVCDIGVDSQHANPATNGTLALWRAGATVPSAEQIKHIYETERPLFEANAQCCLAGTSNAVTALAYDDETDILHVGTSYGRSAFKGLVRVSSEATPVGAITALAASAGVIVQGGASGADVYVPAYTLREELLRDAEQAAVFGSPLYPHDFTATASQTTFTLPVGWEVVAVYQQGLIKKEASGAGFWTRSFDGFKWSIVLGTGATVSDWISILAKRVKQ